MLLHGHENTSDAKSVCEALGIGHEVMDCLEIFAERVIRKFVEVYESGGTPNPCVECNRFLKFGEFLRRVDGRIATGHYARIERSGSGRYLLRKARDLARDQSYVLYVLTQEQLSRTEFPLGGMTKPEVRDLAEELGLVNAKRRDSQDICFVPDGNYGRFIEEYTGKNYASGKFVDSEGKVLGVHRGIIHYTVGQRRGLGIAAKSRLYVSGIDSAKNTITLVSDDDEKLYARGVIVRGVNLIAYERLPENFRACVKTRYRQREIECVVNQTGEDELLMEFAGKERVPAVGQAAVIYDGEYVVGGGTITEIVPL